MFGGKFGKIRFGLRSESETSIIVFANFVESLKNLSGFGSLIAIEENYFDGLNGATKLTPTFPIVFNATDGLKAIIELIGGVVVSFVSESSLLNKSNVSKDIQISENFENELKAKVYIGKDMITKQSFSDDLNGKIEVVKDFIIKNVFTDILSADVSTVILENDIFVAEVTIPAGSVLEIHSDTFDMFLDGVNVLDKQIGDWIFLDRETTKIVIDTGTGGELTGRILYNERYL